MLSATEQAALIEAAYDYPSFTEAVSVLGLKPSVVQATRRADPEFDADLCAVEDYIAHQLKGELIALARDTKVAPRDRMSALKSVLGQRPADAWKEPKARTARTTSGSAVGLENPLLRGRPSLRELESEREKQAERKRQHEERSWKPRKGTAEWYKLPPLEAVDEDGVVPGPTEAETGELGVNAEGESSRTSRNQKAVRLQSSRANE